MELVGPAGVGKTTLARTVDRAGSGVRVLSLWSLPRTRLIRGALAIAPTVAAAVARKGRLGWREIVYMIRLDALRRILRHMMKSRYRVILLDEGPVFVLSWLDLAFTQRGVRAPVSWRRRTLTQWSGLLDSVILLDARDAALAARIHERAMTHRMMRGSDAAIRRFANRFRQAFKTVLQDFGRAGCLVIGQVRTDGPLSHTTARLQATLNRQRHGH